MYEAGCGAGSFAFSLRNVRSSSTLCDESICALRRASFSIQKHGIVWTVMMSNIYDDNSKESGQRHGKKCAVRTKPLRGSAHPPPFLQSACGYSEKWLRILLRAAPRGPTEQERTMARPKRTEGATLRLFIRTTNREKAIIKAQAKKAGLTMSEYMRRTSLNKRIVSKMDQKAFRRACKTRWASEVPAHADQGPSG